MKAKVRDIQGRARDAEGRARGAEEGAMEERGRATEAEERVRVLERAEGRRQESEQISGLETQWAVERREIQLTDRELGRGGWATVSVAMFRGARVAAKCIHGEII